MRDVVQGLRPTDAFAVSHVNELIAAGRWQRAAVALLAARSIQVEIPTKTACDLLARACDARYDAGCQDAIRKITDILMYGTTTGLPTGSLHPPALTSKQMDILLQTLAHYRLPDRALQVFEHALHRNWRPSASAISSIITSISQKLRADDLELMRSSPHSSNTLIRRRISSQRQVWYLRLRTFALEEAKVPLGSDLVLSFMRLLVGEEGGRNATLPGSPASSYGSRRSPVEVVSAPAVTVGTAAGDVDSELISCFGLMSELPPTELRVNASRLLPPLISHCLQRGKVDRALQFLEAMKSQTVPIPVACYNALLEYEALAVTAEGDDFDPPRHLLPMRSAGVSPDVGTLRSLLKIFLASRGIKSGATVSRGAASKQAGRTASSTSTSEMKAQSRNTITTPVSGLSKHLASLSASLGVPITAPVLGFAAFEALKANDKVELEAISKILYGLLPPGSPPPRWLRKVSLTIAREGEA